MNETGQHGYRWLKTGAAGLAAMLEAIQGARESVRLEMYIFAADAIGNRVREALVEARNRGVGVRVLIDAFGSLPLSSAYWEGLIAAGGEFRWFNPITLSSGMFRNHRKLLVVDGKTALLGGYNVSEDWNGDGVTQGWRDLGIQVRGPLVGELAASFDLMFDRAEFRHLPFMRLRKSGSNQRRISAGGELLLSGPGRGFNEIKRSLYRDLANASRIQILASYFLPTWRIRNLLSRRARAGALVQVLMPGRSDVPLMQLAARSLYQRLLSAGVQIFEFQPQILHSKLLLIDDAAYVGSANLDTRSLHINYELMIRVQDPAVAREGRELFEADLALSKRVDLAGWRRSRKFWEKLSERWAYFLLARIDPYVARWQLRGFD